MIVTLLNKTLPRKTAMMVVLISSSIWGLLWIPLRHIEHQGLEGIWANTYFALVGIPVLYYISRPFLSDRSQWQAYLGAGTFIGLGFVFYTLGLIVGSVTKTTLLFYLLPVWASILGILFLGERARLSLWVSNAIGLIGCGLILGISDQEIGFEKVDILGLLSGICWAVGSVIVSRNPNAHYTAVNFVVYIIVVLIGVVGGILTNTPLPDLTSIMAATPVAVLVSAFIFVPAMLFIVRVQQYISPSIVGILMLSEVLFAVLSADWMLGESMGGIQWIGAVMIVFAAAFVTITSR